MTSRLTPALLLIVIATVSVATVSVAAQESQAPDLQGSLERLSAFDYSTRTRAARTLRRLPMAEAVPLLVQAARSHADQFVRYRALVLLTAFNDPGTPALMRTLLGDRNDRVREVAYRWFEQHPDRLLTATLLAALNTELAEFVRPALIRALAALDDNADVQRALLAEAGRGLDFFRSAVIETLGEHRATYAVDALVAVASNEGPLQDDAVLALGRIGDRRALSTLASLRNPPLEVVPALQAALCMLEDGCSMRVTVLSETARSRAASPDATRAAVAALGAIASRAHDGATAALVALAAEDGARLRDVVALSFSGVALRRPDHVISWLDRAPEEVRGAGIELLRDGFQRLEEDFAEEQFYAAARAGYWAAAEGSPTRMLTAALIDKLEF